MPSLYALKPAFQSLLRPLALALHRAHVTANQVTVAACVLSIALGLTLTLMPHAARLWLILPAFFFVRMALNAIDGMLARDFHQQSRLGAYLNELTDVISDAALYLPFAFLPSFNVAWIAVVIWLAALSEMAGVLGPIVDASRRYDGPFGKSDRAFAFGAIALWLGLGCAIAPWAGWTIPRLMALLLAATIINRVRRGLAERKPARKAGH
jgi:CDP-diacylglycerol--glycerol-3-phosphate 3-phosphatidyltransferase